MKIKYYNQQGEEIGTMELLDKFFNLLWNPNFVHQTITTYRQSIRIPYAHAKTRGEVRGGGRKPWRQKGLGRARHGSIRSPIWVGGGVTHGPNKQRNYNRKINKKAKQKTLFTLLSKKFKDEEILIIDEFKLEKEKTGTAKKIIQNLKREKLGKKGGRTMIILTPAEKNLIGRVFKNLPFVEIKSVNQLNILDAIGARYLLFTKGGIELFQKQ